MKSSNSVGLKGYILAILPIVVVSFISRIDVNMYLPALPVLSEELGLSNAQATSTITIYLFVQAIAALVFGCITEYYNKRKLLMAGVCIIITGSLLCSTAEALTQLIAGRCFQAMGGGLILVTSQTWLGQLSSKGNVVRIFAYFSLVMSIAPLTAPVIGGFITHLLSWRYIFYILIVLGVMAFFLVCRSKDSTQQPLHSLETLSFKHSFVEYFKIIVSPSFIPIIGTSMLCYLFQGGFIAFSSFLFIDEMGLNSAMYGVASIPIVAGLILGRFPTIFIERKYGVVQAYRFNSFMLIMPLLLSLLLFYIFGRHTLTGLLVSLSLFNIGFGGHVILSLSNAMTLFQGQRGQVSASLNFLNQSAAYIASYGVQLLFARHISAMTNYNIFAAITIALTMLLYFAFMRNYSRIENSLRF